MGVDFGYFRGPSGVKIKNLFEKINYNLRMSISICPPQFQNDHRHKTDLCIERKVCIFYEITSQKRK